MVRLFYCEEEKKKMKKRKKRETNGNGVSLPKGMCIVLLLFLKHVYHFFTFNRHGGVVLLFNSSCPTVLWFEAGQLQPTYNKNKTFKLISTFFFFFQVVFVVAFPHVSLFLFCFS